MEKLKQFSIFFLPNYKLLRYTTLDFIPVTVIVPLEVNVEIVLKVVGLLLQNPGREYAPEVGDAFVAKMLPVIHIGAYLTLR
jgi:hypothetical protein